MRVHMGILQLWAHIEDFYTDMGFGALDMNFRLGNKVLRNHLWSVIELLREQR